MRKSEYHYILHLQFLGFRFHGWAKQAGAKTVHQMVDKTASFVLGHGDFKTLGCSRTDSKVSALDYAVHLMLHEPADPEQLVRDFNSHFPPDIRALRAYEKPEGFNIIRSPKSKSYTYLFAFGEKPHPFAAPFMACFPGDLDIGLMQQAAPLFTGTHHFRNYCSRPSDTGRFERTVDMSRIEENTVLTASFFPGQSFAYHVTSKGFLRNQVRLMMGRLIDVGRGKFSLEDLQKSLEPGAVMPCESIAPASGLMLTSLSLETE